MTAIAIIIVNYRILTMIDECFISLVSHINNALIRVLEIEYTFKGFNII